MTPKCQVRTSQRFWQNVFAPRRTDFSRQNKKKACPFGVKMDTSKRVYFLVFTACQIRHVLIGQNRHDLDGVIRHGLDTRNRHDLDTLPAVCLLFFVLEIPDVFDANAEDFGDFQCRFQTGQRSFIANGRYCRVRNANSLGQILLPDFFLDEQNFKSIPQYHRTHPIIVVLLNFCTLILSSQVQISVI